MNRGSSRARSTARLESARFNEAPIHESGKSWGCPSLWCQRSSFNEAPIHESGKCQSLQALLTVLLPLQ